MLPVSYIFTSAILFEKKNSTLGVLACFKIPVLFSKQKETFSFLILS